MTVLISLRDKSLIRDEPSTKDKPGKLGKRVYDGIKWEVLRR